MRVECAECGRSVEATADDPKTLYRDHRFFITNATNRKTGERCTLKVCRSCAIEVFDAEFVQRCEKELSKL